MNKNYCLDYNTHASNRSYSTIGYDYHHYNPWEKPNYPTFDYPYSLGAMSSTGGITNKSNTSSYPSFDMTSSLNSSISSFHRRHSI